MTPAEERLLDAFEPIAFASGTVIITQGERHGDKFYVVEDGTSTRSTAASSARAGAAALGERVPVGGDAPRR